jgi:hypothetical protein
MTSWDPNAPPSRGYWSFHAAEAVTDTRQESQCRSR